jgi:hypothetical protein
MHWLHGLDNLFQWIKISFSTTKKSVFRMKLPRPKLMHSEEDLLVVSWRVSYNQVLLPKQLALEMHSASLWVERWEIKARLNLLLRAVVKILWVIWCQKVWPFLKAVPSHLKRLQVLLILVAQMLYLISSLKSSFMNMILMRTAQFTI